jgi:hypothetical protein
MAGNPPAGVGILRPAFAWPGMFAAECERHYIRVVDRVKVNLMRACHAASRMNREP